MHSFVKNISFSTLILAIALAMTTTTTWGQELIFSEPLKMKDNSTYEMVGKVKDKFILIEHNSDTPILNTYDSKLKLKLTKKLSLDRKNTEIFGVIPNKEDFNIFYTHSKNRISYIKAHKYNPEGVLVDSLTISNIPFFSNEYKPAIVNSQNRRVALVYFKEAQHTLRAIAVRTDVLQVLWEKSFKINEMGIGKDYRQIIVTNEGSMYLLGNNDDNLFEKPTKGILLYRYDKKKDLLSSKMIYLPDETYLFDTKFEFDEENNKLSGVGLFALHNNGKASGFFYVSSVNEDSFAITLSPFDDELASSLKNKKIVKNKGIEDIQIAELILRKDGGALLICEVAKEFFRKGYQGYYSPRMEQPLIVDYYNDDILTAAFHPDGSLHWRHLLPKKQFAQDNDDVYSSFFVAKTSESLRFIYNEEINVSTEVAEYALLPEGDYHRKVLLKTNQFSENIMLRVRDAIQTDSQELLIPSEWRGKLRLVKLTLD
ncbi:MAG: hypothetical protein KA010_02740 [Saprospiraceae bacterium]|nr:hypothetical protein [Saprospiraceae bacterium]